MRIHPGRLPRFWDRSAVFVANLLSQFYGNDGQAEALAEQIKEIDSYGGRLLPLIDLLFTGGRNLLVLETEPDGELCAYHQRLGLTLPEFCLTSRAAYRGRPQARGERAALRERLRAHPAPWMDGFVTDRTLVELAHGAGKRTLSSHAGSYNGNNKLLLHRFLAGAGLPTFDTEVAATAGQTLDCCRRLQARGYAEVVIKAPFGGSGVGLLCVPAAGAASAHVPDYLFHEGACLVQGWLADGCNGVELLGSPSVQLFLSEREVCLYDVTEQILDAGSVHEGNLAPPPYAAELPQAIDELLAVAAPVARWLHAQGYRGTASVDFVLLRRAGALQAIAAEINARVTGASYPSILARRFLPGGAWLMRNLRFHHSLPAADVLAALTAAGCLFHPAAEAGVLPINFNLDGNRRVTKSQLLSLGPDAAAVQRMCGLVERAFHVKWYYERD
jgi:hypothetical protein